MNVGKYKYIYNLSFFFVFRFSGENSSSFYSLDLYIGSSLVIVIFISLAVNSGFFVVTISKLLLYRLSFELIILRNIFVISPKLSGKLCVPPAYITLL